MEFKVTINCPDLHDALLALAEAISSNKLPTPATLANTLETHQVLLNAQPHLPTPEQVAQPAPQSMAPVQMPMPIPQPVPPAQMPVAPVAPVAPVNPYTLQQIAIWAVALQEKNPQRLMDILKYFGIQALTQLPHERFGEFVQMLALEGVVTDAR